MFSLAYHGLLLLRLNRQEADKTWQAEAGKTPQSGHGQSPQAECEGHGSQVFPVTREGGEPGARAQKDLPHWAAPPTEAPWGLSPVALGPWLLAPGS